MFPQVSVVIPVKNEAAKIRACIEGILAQTVPVKEIIVIDSGSTDGTIEILEEYRQVKLLQIPSSEFNHGATRNLGVRHASGEFVLLTVGDAKPYDEYWISHLLDGFESKAVAGVCGQQVCPHEINNNPVDWFRPSGPPSKIKYEFPNGSFSQLSPEEKLAACSWDDVTAMYRREVMLQIPFHFTSYCEDSIWAKEALAAGYAIVYNSAARVYHYHNEDADFTFKRNLTTMYMRYRHFGFLYPQTLKRKNYRAELNSLKAIVMAKPLSLKAKWKWFKFNQAKEKAAIRALIAFHEALAKGEKSLDEFHEKYCGKPPVPLKASAATTPVN